MAPMGKIEQFFKRL